MDLATWTIEALLKYKKQLHDQEVEGDDLWFERYQVLWELSRRSVPVLPT